MPLTKKGTKVLAAMKKQYGAKKGKSVFYASVRGGKVTGAEKKVAKKTPKKAGKMAMTRVAPMRKAKRKAC